MKKIFAILFSAFILAGCAYDDIDLWDSILDLEDRVKELEDQVRTINNEVATLKEVVNNLNNGYIISSVTDTLGIFTITFTNGRTITVNDASGSNSNLSPGVAQDDDGIYYWTVTAGGTTSWLLTGDGQKLPVSGRTPVMGVDTDGYWTVDYGDGPEQILVEGMPVKAGAGEGSILSDIIIEQDHVLFILADGTTLAVPYFSGLVLSADNPARNGFSHGQERTYTLQTNGVEQITIAKPDGWRAAVDGTRLSITAPEVANTFAEESGTVSLIGSGEFGFIMYNIEVHLRQPHTFGLENVTTAQLAGPTAYGENLYNGHPDQIILTTVRGINGIDLELPINEAYGEYNIYSGGTALSRWNETATGSYTNQCSVYYVDISTGYGGYGGSQTFALGYGNSFYGDLPEIRFSGNSTAVMESMWMNNATYTARTIIDGGDFNRPFADGDWYKVVITGYDIAGKPTGNVEVMLADYSPGNLSPVVSDWTFVDLSPLGEVAKITFDPQSSDNDPQYGMNTPGYFCFDEIVARL